MTKSQFKMTKDYPFKTPKKFKKKMNRPSPVFCYGGRDQRGCKCQKHIGQLRQHQHSVLNNWKEKPKDLGVIYEASNVASGVPIKGENKPSPLLIDDTRYSGTRRSVKY
jgi:hypothetical protein